VELWEVFEAVLGDVLELCGTSRFSSADIEGVDGVDFGSMAQSIWSVVPLLLLRCVEFDSAQMQMLRWLLRRGEIWRFEARECFNW